MRLPTILLQLLDEGIVDEVLRPLLSGKEADVYLISSDGEERIAKIYKEAQVRQFKHRVMYTEGRKVRNSRDQRAMANRSRYGKTKDETAWRSTEVDMLYRLAAAGVAAPKPYHAFENVVIMELISDGQGFPAPRIGDIDWEPDDAALVVQQIFGQLVRMLTIGVVHADLSPFNILWRPQGPVLIDFPQAIDAAQNSNARQLLLRDVANIHHFASQHIPNYRRRPYGEEMWALFEAGTLTAETTLTGNYRAAQSTVRPEEVLDWIAHEAAEHEAERLGRSVPAPRAKPPAATRPPPQQTSGHSRSPPEQRGGEPGPRRPSGGPRRPPRRRS